jgi:acid phosphatase (class A)
VEIGGLCKLFTRHRAIEVHFPGDVVAGQVYGTMIAERLMERPAFQAQFAAAKQELAGARLD